MFQSNVAETCKHELMLQLPINKNYTLSFVNRTQTLSPQGIFFLPEVPRKGIIWGGIDCWKSLRNPKNPEVEKGLKKLCNRSDARKNTSMPLVHLSQGDSLSKKSGKRGRGKTAQAFATLAAPWWGVLIWQPTTIWPLGAQ